MGSDKQTTWAIVPERYRILWGRRELEILNALTHGA